MKKISKLSKHLFRGQMYPTRAIVDKLNEVIEFINKPVTTTNEEPKCTCCGTPTTRVKTNTNIPVCIDCSH